MTSTLRSDLAAIAEAIPPNARVLDIGHDTDLYTR